MLAVPAADRSDLEHTRQRVLVDVSGWRSAEPEPMPFLAVVQDAIWRERKLQLGYGRADDVHSERVVVHSDWSLRARSGIWSRL